MFLHLGHNLSVRASEVVAIHDFALFAPGGVNRPLFERVQAEGRVADVTGGKRPRALVITTETVYISAISHTTLLRRTQNLYRFVHQREC